MQKVSATIVLLRRGGGIPRGDGGRLIRLEAEGVGGGSGRAGAGGPQEGGPVGAGGDAQPLLLRHVRLGTASAGSLHKGAQEREALVHLRRTAAASVSAQDIWTLTDG
jgi:hypothetical protein